MPFYTCPMHPEVRRDAPGQCPKCGMDLVPVGTAPQERRERESAPRVKFRQQDRDVKRFGAGSKAKSIATNWAHPLPR